MRTGIPTALRCTALPLLVLAGCTGQALPGDDVTGETQQASRVHIMPLTEPGTRHTEFTNGTLIYYGGPVISNARVVTVFWTNAAANQALINQYYSDVTNSGYFDWLDADYNTVPGNGQTGTNQHIGRGSLAGSFVDANAGTSVTDAQIQTRLSALISAGSVPAPDANTYYSVHFPPGVTITDPSGARSCQVFCAYHGTYVRNGQNIYYGVIPDMGGGCATGCGGGSQWQETTGVASHELIEAVTDAAVGIAANLAPPLAWYNNANGEIGDLCNAQEYNLTINGRTYQLQKEWSNSRNLCYAPPNAPSNDFSATISGSQTVAPGSAVSYAINTAITVGAAQTVTPSISALPAGLTAAFNPASFSSGGSATLTITAAANATASTTNFTVTLTGANATHTVSSTVVVSAPDFSLSLAANTGTVASPGSTTFTVNVLTAGNGSSVPVTLAVSGLPTGVTGAFSPATVNSASPAAQSTLTLTAAANLTSGTTSFTVTGTSANVPTHTTTGTLTVNGIAPSNLVANGDFEIGTLASWTSSGTTSVSATAHGGTHAAQLGSSSPTTTSTIQQTIAVPANGTTTLSFWWKSTCPDTVRYDWALVQVLVGGVVKATPLPKTCATNNWTQVNFNLTTYKGQNVTLLFTNRDDNYAGDPTFTLYDDISVTNK